VFDNSIHSDSAPKIPISNAPDHARGRRDPDVAVGEQEDDHGHERDPDPPLAVVVPADLALEDLVHRPAELEVEERRDERLEEDEQPRDEEAGARAEAPRGVGVHAAGRRIELGELADRRRRADARDQREADRQRQRLLRVRHRDEDRVRDSGRRRHVRDGLEQHLRQPDRVLAQMVEACSGGRALHRDPPGTGRRTSGSVSSLLECIHGCTAGFARGQA
jgi:hypothetical protein